MPNISGDRRIGLNVQYLAPHVRQTRHDFEPDAVQRWHELNKIYVETKGIA